MLLVTQRDFLRNLHRQVEGGGGLKSRDLGLPPGAGAFDERSRLALERLARFDLNLGPHNLVFHAPIDFAGLILIIEREIGVFLEKRGFFACAPG
jgi:hypothetical protein